MQDFEILFVDDDRAILELVNEYLTELGYRIQITDNGTKALDLVKEQHFDIVFIRLAPLGPHGVSKVQAARTLLQPGGWLFDAGWQETRYETPATEWALQHGYARKYGKHCLIV